MIETMQAIVFHGPGHWALEEFPCPRIQGADDVLLRVDRVSICGTDIHILSDPPGHPATPGSILGHEYVATVKDVGESVINVKPGDRVVIDPNITCGLCEYCRLGLTNVCENMTSLGIFRHGGLAEFNTAPAKALHKISQDVPTERACLAEPLACVLHAFEKRGCRKSFRNRTDRVPAANGRTARRGRSVEPKDRRLPRRGESHYANWCRRGRGRGRKSAS